MIEEIKQLGGEFGIRMKNGEKLVTDKILKKELWESLVDNQNLGAVFSCRQCKEIGIVSRPNNMSVAFCKNKHSFVINFSPTSTDNIYFFKI